MVNSIFWFGLGEFTNAAGEVVNGDLPRFFAGDPTAGVFMAGFYPIMMFGLPAAALAMYLAAPKANRAKVGGLLFSVALTAFLNRRYRASGVPVCLSGSRTVRRSCGVDRVVAGGDQPVWRTAWLWFLGGCL